MSGHPHNRQHALLNKTGAALAGALKTVKEIYDQNKKPEKKESSQPVSPPARENKGSTAQTQGGGARKEPSVDRPAARRETEKLQRSENARVRDVQTREARGRDSSGGGRSGGGRSEGSRSDGSRGRERADKR